VDSQDSSRASENICSPFCAICSLAGAKTLLAKKHQWRSRKSGCAAWRATVVDAEYLNAGLVVDRASGYVRALALGRAISTSSATIASVCAPPQNNNSKKHRCSAGASRASSARQRGAQNLACARCTAKTVPARAAQQRACTSMAQQHHRSASSLNAARRFSTRVVRQLWRRWRRTRWMYAKRDIVWTAGQMGGRG
jgi:hypothetical protein